MLLEEAPAGLVSTYRFAPSQPCGVILFDIGLQLRPDTQVSLYPVHLLFISEDTRRSCGGSRCICHHNSRTIQIISYLPQLDQHSSLTSPELSSSLSIHLALAVKRLQAYSAL